jgi:hypothetical protein
VLYVGLNVPEPGTLALFGALLLAGWGYMQGRNRLV